MPAELARYEAMAHAIITAHGATVVCVYDASSRAAGRSSTWPSAATASLVEDGGAVRRNERFEYQPA